MLYMFQYESFRIGGIRRSKALDANIVYNDKSGRKGTAGKGFVYRLLVSRASDTIRNHL